MGKLIYSDNKTLKLTNVLKYNISLDERNMNLDVLIEQMKSYIKAKGAVQIGPLIQYTKTVIDDISDVSFEATIMLQCDRAIFDVKHPYSMDAEIRVPNALYCRYIGPRDLFNYAYDKINLEAFENDIRVGNYTYTVFVKHDIEEDILTADVFMPRK